MRIFFKYIIKCILEKLSRTLLVILSIAVTSVLLYATLFSNTKVAEKSRQSLLTEYGDTDFIVSSKAIEDRYLIKDEVIDHNIEKKIDILQLYGTIYIDDVINDITLYGMREEDKGAVTDYEVIRASDKKYDDGIYITEYGLEKLKISLDDEITININDKDVKLHIEGIVKKVGMVYNESDYIKVYMKLDKANEILSTVDEKNLIYMSLKDRSKDNVNATLERIRNISDKLSVTVIDNSMLSDSINNNLVIPMMIILIVSSIMDILIIYTTSNMVIMDRLPVIGTFLSLGMRKKKIIKGLLFEGIVEGIIGGVLGWIIGIFVSVYINRDDDFTSITDYISQLEVNVYYGIASLIFAIVISALSVYAAIRKIKKAEVKNIILNINESRVRNRKYVEIISKLLFVASIIISACIVQDNFIKSILIILSVILAVILLLPILINIIFVQLSRGIRNRMPWLYLSSQNVGSTKMIINNINLIIITLTIMLLVSSVSFAVIAEFDNMFDGFKSDMVISLNSDKNIILNYINEDEDIINFNYLYTAHNVQIKDKDQSTFISIVQAVQSDKYKDYNTYFTYKEGDDILKLLDNGERNIILSLALLNKIDKKVGDDVTVLIDGNEYKYKIVGSVNVKMAFMGSFAFVGKDSIKSDFEIKFPNSIAVKLKENVDIDDYYRKIRRSEIKDYIKSISIDKTKKEQDIEMTSSFLNTIKAVSYMTLVMASIGIINNMMICFIQRRKTFATFDSIGMSKLGKTKILWYEGIITSFICVFISMLAYLIIFKNVHRILEFIGIYINLNSDFTVMINYSFIVVAEVLVTSLISDFKIRRSSIIAELRYE